MSDITTLMMAAAGAGGAEETDPNFNQTVLLLHGDGTNGAQNNTFLDSSTNNFTITRNGNTTQGTFSPFSAPDGRWSNYFNGTGSFLSVTSNNTLPEANESYTVECWFYATGGTQSIAFWGEATTNKANGLRTNNNGNGIYHYWWGNDLNTGDIGLELNAWNHVAAQFDGTTRTIYVNGVLAASDTPVGHNVTVTNNLIIGARASSEYFGGYISNLRIVTGSAVYSSAFTPSTSPLTAISGTSFLSLQSNRFVDNSTNAFAIAPTNMKVTPFSPFAPTAAYDASVNGGSGYFDGTSDNLSVANNAAFQFGTGDFTVEAWVYQTVQRAEPQVIVKCAADQTWNTGWALALGTSNSVVSFWVNGSNVSSSGASTVTLNGWSHVAVSRSGTTLKMFINGVEVDSDTNSTSIVPTAALTVGADITSSTYEFQGYISNVRVVKGTALYTGAFTPSTTPLTAIANTSLLCNFTNAGIFDNTGKNNLETVADAQIDTTTKKFGTGSMEFDGTGDYLVIPDSPDIQLGTGPFTIEAWIYPTSVGGGTIRGISSKGVDATSGWNFRINSTAKLELQFDATSTITSSASISANTWTHIALVREGTGSNQTKLYINGTNDGTGTVSSNFNQTTNLNVGTTRSLTATYVGFIDDFRITKGVARYTTTFTPPTKAFPDL